MDQKISCSSIYAVGSPGAEGEPVFSHGTWQGGHTLNIRGSSSLVVYGGSNGNERTKDLYLLNGLNFVGDDETSMDVKWEKHELQNTQDRAGHISWMRNDKLYCYGGYNSKHLVLSDIVEIDLDSHQARDVTYSTKLQNMDRRWHCGSYISHADKVVVHGGWNDRGPLGDVLIYNCVQNSWETLTKSGKSAAPSPRRWHTFTPMNNTSDSFFIYGGYTADDKKKSSILGDQFIFNLNLGTWTAVNTKGEKPGLRCRHTMSMLGTKQMILIGGYASQEVCKEISILTLDDMKWSKLNPSVNKQLFPILRSGHRAVELEDKGIIIGGGLFLADYIDDFYLLDTRK